MAARCHIPTYFITGGQTGADSIPLRVVSTVTSNDGARSARAGDKKHIPGVRGYLPAKCQRSDGKGYKIKEKFGLWEGAAAVSNSFKWRDKANAGMADACVCFLSTTPKTGRGTMSTANIFVNGKHEFVVLKKPGGVDWLLIGTGDGEEDRAKGKDWRYWIEYARQEETAGKQKGGTATEEEAKQPARTLDNNGSKPEGFSYSFENPKYPIFSRPDKFSHKQHKLEFTKRPVLVFWDVELQSEDSNKTCRLAAILREFLDKYEPSNLMFSGPTEVTCPGIEERGAAMVLEALWGAA